MQDSPLDGAGCFSLLLTRQRVLSQRESGQGRLDFGLYELFCVLERRGQEGSSSHLVASAVEFLCDSSDVHSTPAAERASDATIGQFHKQCGDLDSGDAATFVDEIFCVFPGGAGAFEVLLR